MALGRIPITIEGKVQKILRTEGKFSFYFEISSEENYQEVGIAKIFRFKSSLVW